MNKIIMTLVALFVVSSVVLTAQEPPRDPNAAMRYLMAMGFMPNISDDDGMKIGEVNSLETYEELPLNLKTAVGEASSFRIKKLLEAAAACTQCNFMPDNTFNPEDIAPPFKAIRKFARFLNAGAWKAIKDGRHEDGARMLVSVFRFGDDMENHGPLISYMLGLGIRNIAMGSMQNLVAGDFKAEAKKIVIDYLKSLPRPALPIKEAIAYERKFSEKLLATLESDEGMVELLKQLEPQPQTDTTKEASSCNANQRVIMGAIEMASMDGITFEKFPDFKAIEEKLLTDKYIRKGFECPNKGQYKVEFSDKDFVVSCSCGANPNAAPPIEETKPAVPADPVLLAKAQEYKKSGKFEKDRAEFLEYHDKILAIDDMQPDAMQKITTLHNDYTNRKNLLIDGIAADFTKCFDKQFKLQAEIDNLTK